MTHDPLCPAMNCIDSGCGDCCRCGLIAKVRDGERDSVAAVRLRTVFWEQGYRDGQRDMLAKCIEAVEAITYGTGMGWLDGEWLARQETLTALRALQEQP
jgi:hypothetical protein